MSTTTASDPLVHSRWEQMKLSGECIYFAIDSAWVFLAAPGGPSGRVYFDKQRPVIERNLYHVDRLCAGVWHHMCWVSADNKKSCQALIAVVKEDFGAIERQIRITVA
jgi:hypothetical protein